MPELPEVEVVRRGLDRWVVGRRHRAPSRCCTPARCAGTRPAPPTSRRGWRDAASATRVRARQVPLAAARATVRSESADALLAHLGMSGQLLVQPPATADETAPAGADCRFADGAPRAALRRPAHVRGPGGRAAGRPRRSPRRARCPAPRSRTSPATRSTRTSTTRRCRPAAAPPAHRDQAGAARPDPGLGRRQHLRRRGAVAGAAALRPADRDVDPAGGRSGARSGPRGDGGGAGRGRHVLRRLYVNVNGESAATSTARCEVYGQRRAALLALRDADPPGRVHEPVVLHLPGCQPRPRRGSW